MGIKETFDQFIKSLEDKEKLNKNSIPDSKQIEEISQYTLVELSKRNMALEIYSEILGCTIWLCSNEAMVKKIKTDDHEAVTYTIEEMRHLLTLKVSPEEIKRIHNAKCVFNGSKIVDSKIKVEVPEFLK
ncbi:hypothetical protein MYX76_04440 [Desulfobacterota bacterium AH_259_B03_O07]|nr:hypothetical protein [Desulfobacterota bacterium AH_259_B03_O07]